MTNVISDMSPAMKVTLGIILGAFVLIGGAAMIAGQIILGILIPIQYMFGVKAVQSIGLMTGALLRSISVVLLLYAAFEAMSWVNDTFGPSMESWIVNTGIAMLALLGAAKLLGLSLSPLLGYIAVLASFVSLLMLARSMTDNWKDAFVLLGLSIVRSVQLIGSYITTALLSPILALVELANKAKKFVTGEAFYEGNAFGNAQQIIDQGVGGGAVQKQIESLMSDNAIRKGLRSGEIARPNTMYSQIYLKNNPDVKDSDPIGYWASMINAGKAPGGGDTLGGGVPTGQDLLDQYSATPITPEKTTEENTELADLKAQLDKLKEENANLQTGDSNNNATKIDINVGTIIGDTDKAMDEIEQHLQQKANRTFGSPSQ